MIEFRLLGRAEHQAHATAVEEREVRNLEEKTHAQRVAVESHDARQILDNDGNLPDAIERYLVRHTRGHDRLRGKKAGTRPPGSTATAEISLAMLTIMHTPESPRKPRDEAEVIADRLHSAAIHL